MHAQRARRAAMHAQWTRCSADTHARPNAHAALQAPDVMRSCCSALALLATASGGYLSAGLMYLTSRFTTWLDNLNDPTTSHLDLYFYLLAAFMLANTLLFAYVAASYKYKVVKHRAPLPLVGGQQHHAVMQRPVSGVPTSHARSPCMRRIVRTTRAVKRAPTPCMRHRSCGTLPMHARTLAQRLLHDTAADSSSVPAGVAARRVGGVGALARASQLRRCA
jgi:hypothetical protein